MIRSHWGLTALTILLSLGAADARAAFTLRTARADARVVTRDPDDRCELSRVFVGARSVDAEVGVLRDADAASGLTLSQRNAESVTFTFIGASRWLNTIDVTTNAAAYDVEVLDQEGVWRPYVHAENAAALATPAHLTGDDVEVRGLRFVPRGDAPSVRLFEMSAHFVQTDPDAARLGRADAAGNTFHTDWVNNYNNVKTNLSNCDDDAQGLGDELPSSWSGIHHGDINAREEHFKRTDLGGTNGDHVDNNDLSYFSGHGTTFNDTYYGDTLRSCKFESTVDDSIMTPGDGHDALGDGDMEWLGLACCKPLRSDSDNSWATAMEGLHLILGWETNMKDVALGPEFIRQAVDNGAFDGPEKIKDAWFDAAENTHGSGYTAAVIGETSTMGNDYLWGEGTVASDPVDDGTFSRWTYNTTIFAGPGGGRSRQEATLSTSALPFNPSDPVTVRPTADSWPIRIDRALLDAGLAAPMPVYNVTAQPPADSFYVRMIANKFCQITGRLCGGDIGPGNPGDLNLFDGFHHLRVNQNVGAVRYTDTFNWLKWRTSPPELYMGQQAIDRANSLLTQLGRLREDGMVDRVDFVTQSTSTDGDNVPDDPDSSFATASRVVYLRQLDGRDVVGPGASMTVTLGQNGALQRFFEGGWRPVTQGASVNVLPFAVVLSQLSQYGADATIDGVNPYVYGLDINSWRLGYYEYGADAKQMTIRPCYIIDANVYETPPGVEPPVIEREELHVWAEAMNPVPTINGGSLGALGAVMDTCIVPGAPICLSASATFGVPPYTFTWYDNIDGYLGTGPSGCATLSLPPTSGDGSEDSTHTIKCVVTDALGHKGHAFVNVCLAAITSVFENTPLGDASAPSIAFVQTNPSLGSARIVFEMPAGGDASVDVYDLSGRRVASVHDRSVVSGRRTVEWNGRVMDGAAAPAGVYFARLTTPHGTAVRQFTLVR